MASGLKSRAVTVVCLTYGRPWSVDWQKALWAPYPVDLIIADGSQGIAHELTSGTAKACRWSVFSMPNASYSERLRRATEAIRTRHAILVDDEEAYFYSGLLRASTELDEIPSASCAGGSAGYLRSVDGRIRLRPFSGRIADWSIPFELREPYPTARIEKVLSTYRSGNLYYSVVRSEFLKDFASAGALPEIEGTLVGSEFLWAAALAASGTYSMGDYPFWLRMGGSQPSAKLLRDRLVDSEIDAIASRIEAVCQHNPEWTTSGGAIAAALRRGIRRYEERVFGPQMPSREEARQRSREVDYLQSFLSPESYLARFVNSESLTFGDDLRHIINLAQSAVRPVESLDDAMA